VNWSAATSLLVPPWVVTVTWTVPASPGGEVAVIWVAEFTVKAVASVLPNSTSVAPDRFVPVIITDVAPAVGPEDGERPVTAGIPA